MTSAGPIEGAGRTERKLRQLAELPVTALHTVGPRTERELAELGVDTVLDLLTYYPRRYIDGTRLLPIAGLAAGDKASVLARVTRVSRASPGYGRGRRRGPSRVELQIADDTGHLRVVFFNQSWRAKQLPVGTLALFFGSIGTYRDALQLNSPMAEVLELAGGKGEEGNSEEGSGAEGNGGAGREEEGGEEGALRGRIYPVYPLSDKAKLTSVRIGRIIVEALDRAKDFADPVESSWRERFGLVDRTTAFNHIHRPGTADETEPARRRLAFDELFRLQLALVLRQARLQRDARGIRHVVDGAEGDRAPTLVRQFLDGLPFELTRAQRDAMAAIRSDLAGALPMHRLLQGDVGSGKTVVALAAMLTATQGGHQAALMAPTEVLAEQHADEVRRLLGGPHRPRPVDPRGPSSPGRGAVDQPGGCLGAEPHPRRVGCRHRRHPRRHPRSPHRAGGLPLPRGGGDRRAAPLRGRTTGRPTGQGPRAGRGRPRPRPPGDDGDADPAHRGDGGLRRPGHDHHRRAPPGRQPVVTRWLRSPLEAEEAWSRVREQVAAGHRAFVVCPLVEGSDRVQATSVVAEAERLAATELAGLRMGLLHGQLPSAEKERVMAEFRSGAVEVLVATTVIEVGVDVPEASVMVIEDADRFGIAQLHQLRGRVGRGNEPAWCYLLSENEAPEPEARLSAMEGTTDGFALAEVDLRLRGEGTILGARQKGRSDLRLAKLLGDQDLVVRAREMAVSLVGTDPRLAGHPLLVDELRISIDEDEAEFLFKS